MGRKNYNTIIALDLFNNIQYLKTGTACQQRAYALLQDNNVIVSLHQYSPILAGTIPLAIDIEGSDLDILCQFSDQQLFINSLQNSFSKFRNYNLRQVIINNEPTVIANFYIDDFEVEVFGQAVPLKQQAGYCHMIIEYNILLQKGEEFRKQIIALKKASYKTEPVFAKLLGLQGDPYIELLNYKL